MYNSGETDNKRALLNKAYELKGWIQGGCRPGNHPFRDAVGLCGNLGFTDITNSLMYWSVLVPYLKTWPLVSHTPTMFPIFDQYDKLRDSSYTQYHHRSKYKGRQLELRLSLLDHIIKCLESDL